MSIHIKLKPNDSVERAITKLKNIVIKEGLYKELKDRRYYAKPSLKKKLKREEAARQRMKDQHKLKNGLVFKVKEDSFVTSPMDGTVVYANKFKSFGNLVMIKDNKGFTSVLIGMRSLLISTGNEVLAGEPIAKISSTLQSQLYFELRENGKIVDPKSKVEIL